MGQDYPRWVWRLIRNANFGDGGGDGSGSGDGSSGDAGGAAGAAGGETGGESGQTGGTTGDAGATGVGEADAGSAGASFSGGTGGFGAGATDMSGASGGMTGASAAGDSLGTGGGQEASTGFTGGFGGDQGFGDPSGFGGSPTAEGGISSATGFGFSGTEAATAGVGVTGEAAGAPGAATAGFGGGGAPGGAPGGGFEGGFNTGGAFDTSGGLQGGFGGMDPGAFDTGGTNPGFGFGTEPTSDPNALTFGDPTAPGPPQATPEDLAQLANPGRGDQPGGPFAPGGQTSVVGGPTTDQLTTAMSQIGTGQNFGPGGIFGDTTSGPGASLAPGGTSGGGSDVLQGGGIRSVLGMPGLTGGIDLEGGGATATGPTIGPTIGVGGAPVIDTVPGPTPFPVGGGTLVSGTSPAFEGLGGGGDPGSLFHGGDSQLLAVLQGNGVDPNAFLQARQSLFAQLQQMGFDLSGANVGLLNQLALRLIGSSQAGGAGNPPFTVGSGAGGTLASGNNPAFE